MRLTLKMCLFNMFFWNKKVTQEEFESCARFCSDRHYQAVNNINPRLKNLETKLDLILDHLKLKYVPETETKEAARLVKKINQNPFFNNLENGAIIQVPNEFGGLPFAYGGGDLAARLYNSNFAEEMDDYILAQAKAGQPKKKPEFTGSEYKAVPGGFIITPPAKKRGRPKKK